MNLKPHSQPETLYQIRVKGHLPNYWSDWFEGMSLTLDTERGETILSGPLVDQAALHGLLIKVRDLGLTLLSVNQVEADDK
ncbi:MAG: hypothetical protein U0401_19570 [Anaerolineae bacterium]